MHTQKSQQKKWIYVLKSLAGFIPVNPAFLKQIPYCKAGYFKTGKISFD
jgi:hypothetical protein